MKTTKILPPDDTFADVAKPSATTKHSVKHSLTPGLISLAVALGLGLLPWFMGIGWAWTLVLAIGAWFLWREEKGEVNLPQWFAPLFAAVVAAHAFRVLEVRLMSLLWMVAALLVCRAVWLRFKNSNLASSVDPKRVWRGYRVYVFLGAIVCLLSLSQTWGRTPDWWSFGWTGAMQTRLANVGTIDINGNYTTQLQTEMYYNPIAYTNNWLWPGFEYSARSAPFVTWVIVALFGVLGWAMLRSDEARKYTTWILGALSFVALWCVMQRSTESGAMLFLISLLVMAFGVWKLKNGEENGQHDAATLLRGTQEKLNLERR